MDFEDVVAYFRGMSLTESIKQLSELLDNIMIDNIMHANPEVNFYAVQDALDALILEAEE